jgi:tRNA(Leu) C34 or U34 (ribose-2'-O)-methylase TrmL
VPGKITPAVILVSPKQSGNVAGALRACSAFGVAQLRITGYRALPELSPKGKPRTRRELRMEAYSDVDVIHDSHPFGAYAGARIIAVEVMDDAVPLTWFSHPDDAVYVFGPEDGSLGRAQKIHCTDFVIIPSRHCLNLACAVNVVLADRVMKQERGRADASTG